MKKEYIWFAFNGGEDLARLCISLMLAPLKHCTYTFHYDHIFPLISSKENFNNGIAKNSCRVFKLPSFILLVLYVLFLFGLLLFPDGFCQASHGLADILSLVRGVANNFRLYMAHIVVVA